MKKLNILISSFILIPFFALSNDVPPGYSEKELEYLLHNTKSIITRVQRETSSVFQYQFKMYFPSAIPHQIVDLIGDIGAYPGLFEDINQGEILTSNEDKTSYSWAIQISKGFSQYMANFDTRISLPDNRDGVITMQTTLLNNKDLLNHATQKIIFTPYEGGSLVTIFLDIELASPTWFIKIYSQTIQSKYQKILQIFRNHL